MPLWLRPLGRNQLLLLQMKYTVRICILVEHLGEVVTECLECLEILFACDGLREQTGCKAFPRDARVVHHGECLVHMKWFHNAHDVTSKIFHSLILSERLLLAIRLKLSLSPPASAVTTLLWLLGAHW